MKYSGEKGILGFGKKTDCGTPKKGAWIQGAGKAAYFQEGRREKKTITQPFTTP